MLSSAGKNPLVTVGSTEVAEGMHCFEIIDDAKNTRSCTIKEQPKDEPPCDKSDPLFPSTPDPSKAFEAVLALKALQEHYL